MVLSVLAKILRLLGSLSAEDREEVMNLLRTTLYPTPETGNAARCRRKRERRKARLAGSLDLVADPLTRVAGGSPGGSRPGSPDPPNRVAGGSHAVVSFSCSSIL